MTGCRIFPSFSLLLTGAVLLGCNGVDAPPQSGGPGLSLRTVDRVHQAFTGTYLARNGVRFDVAVTPGLAGFADVEIRSGGQVVFTSRPGIEKKLLWGRDPSPEVNGVEDGKHEWQDLMYSDVGRGFYELAGEIQGQARAQIGEEWGSYRLADRGLVQMLYSIMNVNLDGAIDIEHTEPNPDGVEGSIAAPGPTNPQDPEGPVAGPAPQCGGGCDNWNCADGDKTHGLEKWDPTPGEFVNNKDRVVNSCNCDSVKDDRISDDLPKFTGQKFPWASIPTPVPDTNMNNCLGGCGPGCYVFRKSDGTPIFNPECLDHDQCVGSWDPYCDGTITGHYKCRGCLWRAMCAGDRDMGGSMAWFYGNCNYLPSCAGKYHP